jgi:hypothetical protein
MLQEQFALLDRPRFGGQLPGAAGHDASTGALAHRAPGRSPDDYVPSHSKAGAAAAKLLVRSRCSEIPARGNREAEARPNGPAGCECQCHCERTEPRRSYLDLERIEREERKCTQPRGDEQSERGCKRPESDNSHFRRHETPRGL